LNCKHVDTQLKKLYLSKAFGYSEKQDVNIDGKMQNTNTNINYDAMSISELEEELAKLTQNKG
jgi:hypothetical protein